MFKRGGGTCKCSGYIGRTLMFRLSLRLCRRRHVKHKSGGATSSLSIRFHVVSQWAARDSPLMPEVCVSQGSMFSVGFRPLPPLQLSRTPVQAISLRARCSRRFARVNNGVSPAAPSSRSKILWPARCTPAATVPSRGCMERLQ